MTESVTVRPSAHSYLKDNSTKNKKAKDTKKYVIKRKLKFQDYKHSLEAAQFEKKLNQLEEKVDMDSLRENNEEFIKKQ